MVDGKHEVVFPDGSKGGGNGFHPEPGLLDKEVEWSSSSFDHREQKPALTINRWR